VTASLDLVDRGRALAIPSGAIREGRGHSGQLELDADVVIVGSGAGGSVAAATLAEAGQRVVVLEEGGYVPPERYGRMRPSETMRHLWRDAGMSFAIGVGDTPMINMMMGRCIGGSSVLTGGVCFRVPESVLDFWQHERGLVELTAKHMEPFFEQVERDVHVEEVPVAMRSRSTSLFAEGAEKLGHPLKPLRRNTNGCNGCGRCNFGCPHGAKLSVDVTYLPRAIRAGATVWSDCLVDRVLTRGDRAIGVEGRVLNRSNGKPGGRLRVRARRVVVAAGGYHTPLVLERTGVGRRSGQVGRNMTVHPSFRVMARFDEPVRGWAGALQSAWSDAYEHERITLVGMFVPPGVLAATMPGVADEHVARARSIPNLAVFGGMIHDEGGGTVRSNPFGREPFVTYRMAPEDRATVPTLMRRMAAIYFAAGAREVFLPILGSTGVDADQFRKLDLEHVPMTKMECSSQHPLGTCRMGVSPNGSVVDAEGRAWDLRELYVADGSVVPTSLGVNPQLTVMAMALRTARRMLDRKLPDA
jgi:choline dehydrogenase-like flavoprotein